MAIIPVFTDSTEFIIRAIDLVKVFREFFLTFQQMIVEPGSTSYEMWETLPIPMYMKLFYFNITNSKDIEDRVPGATVFSLLVLGLPPDDMASSFLAICLVF